jgi:hypothetical protein
MVLTVEAMGFTYYASSPVLIPPQNHCHLIAGLHHEAGSLLHSSSSSSSPAAPSHPPDTAPSEKYVSKYPRPPSLNYLSRAFDGVAGRKRPRADCDDAEAEADDELEASSRPISRDVHSRPEPIMGPGMTLIYPDSSALNISPESQSGTWMEDQAAANVIPDRPKLLGRKSQRRISDPKELDDIDPIVMKLGIGWKRLTDNQAAGIPGSEMFIHKHFPLTNPRILLHHEGLSVYVVRSDPASAQGYWHQWWLFREDLRSARFLCNDDNDLFRRLGNKRQDERGCWIPDILCEGPEMTVNDGPVMGVFSNVSPTENYVAVVGGVEQTSTAHQAVEDVEMEGVE